ncbi:Gfo/Idh/MocA family oxidoreductase [Catenulispora pinistramenti]|uniref:Gfo/Idh/MocA family protein n=1 Tax=Catenulispora pinistramenti TaxID=2705254 RepID=UPI002E7599E0|nr:Gfo/Idh/MocA family oxidoreductase [Catenulispora pinistramenti]
MTHTKIRWGILATGSIAATFTKDLLTLDDAEVVAVGSRTLDSAKEFADRHGIPRAYGTWAELAADPEVDIVYVATPHSAHHEASALCLDAGKAVLCEKPLTLDAAQAEDLCRRAEAAGVFFMEAMWTRCVPAVLRMVEMVRAGAIGEPRLVTADFSVVFEGGPEHRMRDPALGGGALLDLGVYPLAISQLVFGTPSVVQAVATLTPEGVDDTTAVTLVHPGGGVSALTCSLSTDGTWSATVAGTEGRIEFGRGYTSPSGFSLFRQGELLERVEAPFLAGGMVHEAIEAQRCLREGLRESPLAPWSETLAVMRTMDTVRGQVGVVYPEGRG